MTELTKLTELTELTELHMLTVETVETVQTDNLKKYELITHSLSDNLKARDASASKKGERKTTEENLKQPNFTFRTLSS